MQKSTKFITFSWFLLFIFFYFLVVKVIGKEFSFKRQKAGHLYRDNENDHENTFVITFTKWFSLGTGYARYADGKPCNVSTNIIPYFRHESLRESWRVTGGFAGQPKEARWRYRKPLYLRTPVRKRYKLFFFIFSGGMGVSTQKMLCLLMWNFTQPQRRIKFCHLQVNGWNWRISS
jgi:hypothetical protein